MVEYFVSVSVGCIISIDAPDETGITHEMPNDKLFLAATFSVIVVMAGVISVTGSEMFFRVYLELRFLGRRFPGIFLNSRFACFGSCVCCKAPTSSGFPGMIRI